MSTYGDYLGEVSNALTNLTADGLEPVRDRLIPQAATPEDLPEPRPRETRLHHDQPGLPAVDPSMPLFVVLDGPGVIGL